MSDAVGCGNISGETLDLYKPPAARLAIAAQHFQVGVRTPCATGRILLTHVRACWEEDHASEVMCASNRRTILIDCSDS